MLAMSERSQFRGWEKSSGLSVILRDVDITKVTRFFPIREERIHHRGTEDTEELRQENHSPLRTQSTRRNGAEEQIEFVSLRASLSCRWHCGSLDDTHPALKRGASDYRPQAGWGVR